jgi:hypothetical protein
MATTVPNAFNEFRMNTVDLDSGETATARRSRDYLIDQLKGLPGKVSGFPPLTNDFIHFGSFARKTKIRPLDDIDLMMLLKGTDTEEVGAGLLAAYTYRVRIKSASAPLALFADDQGYVNSNRILNKIKSSVASVPNYSRADIAKNMQAVTLNLTSYTWLFDIVPALSVGSGPGQITHYLIPNGQGNWIRTDPRVDAQNVTEVNTTHVQRLLPVMRLLKYWNRRTHKPRMRPYHFETLVLNTFRSASPITTYRAAVKYFFEVCQTSLWLSCPDPKGLGPNLDQGIDYETKRKIAAAMSEAAVYAQRALKYEADGNHKDAIAYWSLIFGSGFPGYG